MTRIEKFMLLAIVIALCGASHVLGYGRGKADGFRGGLAKAICEEMHGAPCAVKYAYGEATAYRVKR